MSRYNSYLESQQAEQLASIGLSLQQHREDAKLTHSHIHAATLIRPSLLKAIEAGDLKKLPEPVYIRGLIKRYGDALGLDGDALAAEFPVDASVRPTGPSWRDLPAAQLRPLHLYVAYILLITAAISGLSHTLNRSAAPVGDNQILLQQAPQTPVEGTPAIAPAPTQAPSAPTDGSKSVRVEVSVTASSWIQVVADGRTEFEDTLAEGSQRSWSANDQITIVAGNAGGVVVTYNGGQAQPLGEMGSVAEVTFSAAESTAALPSHMALGQPVSDR